MDALEGPLTVPVIEKIEKIFEQFSELHDTFSSDHAIKMVRRLHPLLFDGIGNAFQIPGTH